jgi:hypothetical protein
LAAQTSSKSHPPCALCASPGKCHFLQPFLCQDGDNCGE